MTENIGTAPVPPAVPNPTPGQLAPAGQLIASAWRMFIGRLGMFMLFALAQLGIFALNIALLEIGVLLGNIKSIGHNSLIIGAYWLIVVAIVIWSIYIWFRIFLSQMYIPTSDQAKTFKEYYALSRGKISQYFTVLLISGLVIFGGYVFFIIPGIIFSIQLSLAPWTFLVEGRTGTEALQQSRRYARGRFWALLGRNLLYALIIIAFEIIIAIIFHKNSYIFQGINSLINILITGFGISFSYLLYQNVASIGPARTDEPKKWQLTVLAVLAVVGFVLLPILVAITGLYKYNHAKLHQTDSLSTSTSVNTYTDPAFGASFNYQASFIQKTVGDLPGIAQIATFTNGPQAIVYQVEKTPKTKPLEVTPAMLADNYVQGLRDSGSTITGLKTDTISLLPDHLQAVKLNFNYTDSNGKTLNNEAVIVWNGANVFDLAILKQWNDPSTFGDEVIDSFKVPAAQPAQQNSAITTPKGAYAYYTTAAQTVSAKCGDSQLLEYLTGKDSKQEVIDLYFFSAGICGTADQSVAVSYNVTTHQQTFNPDPLTNPGQSLQPIPLEKWNITYSQALTTALQNGGQNYLNSNPGSSIKIAKLSNENGSGSESDFLWHIAFTNADQTQTLDIAVDPETGAYRGSTTSKSTPK